MVVKQDENCREMRNKHVKNVTDEGEKRLLKLIEKRLFQMKIVLITWKFTRTDMHNNIKGIIIIIKYVIRWMYRSVIDELKITFVWHGILKLCPLCNEFYKIKYILLKIYQKRYISLNKLIYNLRTIFIGIFSQN